MTPTPIHDELQLKSDLDEFTRQLRLKEYFFDRDNSSETHLVSNKSDFIPPENRNVELDQFIDFVNRLPVGRDNSKTIRPNLNQSERDALKLLRSRPDIVIKEADKGSSVVILNKAFYQEKITEMLQDTDTYTKLNKNPDRKTLNCIDNLVKNCDNSMTKKEKEYLTKFEHKTSNFYGLPKVHKSDIIKQAIYDQNSDYVTTPDPADLKFRPVVAGPICVTSRLSNLIDILLRPFIPHVKSYVRDDIDFLNHLPSDILDNEIIISLDAASLYTNIDHNLALTAIQYWLEKHPEHIHGRFSQEFILKGIELILKNNAFDFGNLTFLQTSGVAMGTKMAPTLCTLVLGYLENLMFDKIEKDYSREVRLEIEKRLKRFLDDVFIIINPEHISVNDFILLLNSMHPKIGFSGNFGRDPTPFLDILVIIKGTQIHTDIYRKSTDSQSYLDYKSCHPRSTKNNIPYCLARRICCIVSEENNKEIHLQQLKEILIGRNYPIGVIDKGIQMAKALSLDELRKPKEPRDNEVLPLVVDFCPSSPNVFNQIKDSFEMLKNTSPRMREVLNDTNLIKSNRQGPNLRKLLTRAKFETEPQIGSFPCKLPRCKCCPEIITTSQIDFAEANEVFDIKTRMTCVSKNVLYKLTCRGCNQYYIGQTGDELKQRTNLHRWGIRENQSLDVDKHIHDCAINCDPKFNIVPFFKVTKDNKKFRESKESEFINRFKPTLNR